MAGRFPLYADADVRGPLVKALKRVGWDVVRAIDELPEGAEEPPHFERAVALGRVFVANDEGQEIRANKWYRQGRAFPRLITWRQKDYSKMTYGEIVEVFEELGLQENPFSPYHIVRINPKR